MSAEAAVIEAIESLIGSACKGDGDAMSEVAGLDPRILPDDPLIRAVCAALGEMHREGEAFDLPRMFNLVSEAESYPLGHFGSDLCDRFAAKSTCNPWRCAGTIRESARQAEEREKRHKLAVAFEDCEHTPTGDLRHILADSDLFDGRDLDPSEWCPADVAKWLENEPPARDWLFRDRFATGDLCGLVASGGAGKTYLALALAVSLASGVTLLETFVPDRPRKVLVIAGEDAPALIWKRLRAIVAHYGMSNRHAHLASNLTVYAGHSEPLTVVSSDGSVSRTARYQWLRDALKRHDPALVVLDPKCRFDGGPENDAASSTAFAVALQDLIGARRAMLVLHHVSKADEGAARGSTAFRDSVRWLASLTRPDPADIKRLSLPDDIAPYLTRLQVPKSNYAAIPAPTVLYRTREGVPTDFDAGKYLVAAEAHLLDRLVEFIEADPTAWSKTALAKNADVRDRLNCTARQLETALERGLLEGRLRLQIEGRKATIMSENMSHAICHNTAQGGCDIA